MIVKLALENGTVFTGENFGAEGEITGEVVFNTSITGYQEILTDPSYAGQIVTMTYPLIGNYGVNLADVESVKPQVSGFIVREYFDFYSNWRATSSLGDWLKKNNIIAIQGIDTRMLTKMIRTLGALRGVLSTKDIDDASLVKKAKASPDMNGRDLAKKVTCSSPYTWGEIDRTIFALAPQKPEINRNGERFKVVVYDYGVKQNILRRLTRYGCSLTVVPASYSAEQVLAMNPDGIFLSNGPGDPDAVKYAIMNLKKFMIAYFTASGSPGPLERKIPVQIHSQHLFGGIGSRNHCQAAAITHKAAQNILLHAVMVNYHFENVLIYILSPAFAKRAKKIFKSISPHV